MKTYFESIYKNEDTVSYFASAIENGKLAHAYILEGPTGSGKRTLAKAIAYARVKDSPYANKILNDQSPDVLYFGVPEKKKTIGVDVIRALKNDVYIKSSELDAKFFILTDCQLMTDSAQNAALKILEEPPQNVYFFLCTDSASALLPTVRSRAQTIRMQIFTDEELAQYAKKDPKWNGLSQSDPARFSFQIRKAGGCIGRLSQDTNDANEAVLHEKALNVISLLDAGEYTPMLLYCNKLAPNRSDLDAVLLKIALGLRDALAVRNGVQGTLQLFSNADETLAATKHLTACGILSAITEIEKTRKRIAANPNLKGIQILLADTLLRAIQN